MYLEISQRPSYCQNVFFAVVALNRVTTNCQFSIEHAHNSKITSKNYSKNLKMQTKYTRVRTLMLTQYHSIIAAYRSKTNSHLPAVIYHIPQVILGR